VLKRRPVRADTTRGAGLHGGSALSERPSRFVITTELVALVAAVGLAVLVAPAANWDLVLLFTLLAFSVVSDISAATTSAKVKISGSFLSLVLAMVFLGGTPACLIGVATILVGWLKWRDAKFDLLNNLVAYAWFPLIGGLVFGEAAGALELGPADGSFYLLVLGVFVLALAVNFMIIALHTCAVERTTLRTLVRQLVVPVVSSEVAAATMAVGIAYLYHRVGIAAIALFGIVLFTFQYLLGQLLISESRAEELERRGKQLSTRTRQLATLQVGMLSALLRTLDLRDRMTARHSAAVARYAREIAIAAGFSKEDQDLVHTAGLLHDLGKFIFPDRILKSDTKLTDEDWNIIKMHPYQGARVVAQMEGYGPVSDIILAHHERIDGKGYPRGLKGDNIPALSRIISVADTYDVMTARDSYRKPISSFEAIQELKRVAGAQLDAEYVELFIKILAGKDVRFRHGEDADFDAELGLDKRVAEYSLPIELEEELAEAASDGEAPVSQTV
jgi:putative nucleotidyltransferase with HDIG domain